MVCTACVNITRAVHRQLFSGDPFSLSFFLDSHFFFFFFLLLSHLLSVFYLGFICYFVLSVSSCLPVFFSFFLLFILSLHLSVMFINSFCLSLCSLSLCLSPPPHMLCVCVCAHFSSTLSLSYISFICLFFFLLFYL